MYSEVAGKCREAAAGRVSSPRLECLEMLSLRGDVISRVPSRPLLVYYVLTSHPFLVFFESHVIYPY